MTKRITISVPDQVYEDWVRIAEKQKRNLSSFARHAIKVYIALLDQMEKKKMKNRSAVKTE